jgi:5-methyltetrahydrofolate--homocysteine methyltransferase
MFKYEELTAALINGRAKQCKELTQSALDQGESPYTILNSGLVEGMSVVGRRFKENEFFVPEVLIAARAMKNAMEILRPKLAEAGVQPLARGIIGTVQGDLHDIGKNLVAMMLEGAGFEIMDLGVDVKAEDFVKAAKDSGIRLLLLSALLTTTMPEIRYVIEALEGAGIRDQVTVMIGGAPVTQSYADEVGADGYSLDAADAVIKAKELLHLQ